MSELIRLNKYIAECGVCSRREADRLIDDGRVTVNGVTANMGVKVSSGDVVTVNGKRLEGRNDKVVLAYYKPVGVTCTENDRHAQVTIKDVLDYPVRVTYAGRLDRDSEGLLLMTNDGELINALMKGANGHEKEYIVKVNKELNDEIKTKMEEGLFLKELNQKTKPCRVELLGKYTFRIILTQGLNRQIRRMCEAFDLTVISLKRIRVANIELGKLKSGTLRRITGDELDKLYESINRKDI